MQFKGAGAMSVMSPLSRTAQPGNTIDLGIKARSAFKARHLKGQELNPRKH